ncbi:hypothetical protein EI94DRAFT_87120 [Lactarius quietus]|nr:hypothetical protein EI94DRAFT_87120 [Lactarius quietus]
MSEGGNASSTSKKQKTRADAFAVPDNTNSIRNVCMRHWNSQQPGGQGLAADFDAYFKALSKEDREPFKKEMRAAQGAAVRSRSIRTSHSGNLIILAESGQDIREEGCHYTFHQLDVFILAGPPLMQALFTVPAYRVFHNFSLNLCACLSASRQCFCSTSVAGLLQAASGIPLLILASLDLLYVLCIVSVRMWCQMYSGSSSQSESLKLLLIQDNRCSTQ